MSQLDLDQAGGIGGIGGISELPWLREILSNQYTTIYRGVIKEFLLEQGQDDLNQDCNNPSQVNCSDQLTRELDQLRLRFIDLFRVQLNRSSYFPDHRLIRVARAITGLAADKIELIDSIISIKPIVSIDSNDTIAV